MSNYVKTTNFAVKDSLASGNPAKIIKGTEHNVEYDAIQVAIETKADSSVVNTVIADVALKAPLANPIFTGTVTAPTVTVTGSLTAKDIKGSSNDQIDYGTAGLESRSSSGDVYLTLHAAGSTAATFKHVRGGNGVEVRDATNTLANIIAANITSNGVLLGAPFPSGTRMLFLQAAAPTGWTQDISDTATNRMLRVMNGSSGNTGGGVHSPILNNFVPAHTHGFTTGNVSSDHTHSGTTSTESNYHTHNYNSTSTGGGIATGGGSGTVEATGNNNQLHTHSFTTGGISTNHTHSGSTDNGSSQTNWQPRYLDAISCSKN